LNYRVRHRKSCDNQRAARVQRSQISTSDDLIRLLQRCAARDRAAFDDLYSATSSKLYGVVFRILNRRDVADDVLQEAFVKIWERAGAFDPGRGAAITWMATIARHTALDQVRRVTPVSIEDRPDVLEMPSDEPSPLALLQKSENAGQLRRCLDGLEPEKRDLVMLAYMQGYSREELAQKFNRPVPTIKTWLHRSLAQLKDCLTK
jgi:RNA polymerase sigma-70 factor, ECF subfamily